MRFVRIVHIGLVMFMLPVAAMAQVISPTAKPFNPIADQVTAPNPETYGTSSETAITLSEWEFNPWKSSTTFDWAAGRYTTNSGALVAGVHLPAGASITKIVVQACNSNPTATAVVVIIAKPNTGNGTVTGGGGHRCELRLYPLDRYAGDPPHSRQPGERVPSRVEQ
jgi:hypothetical protein